jgi:hypothetical protein
MRPGGVPERASQVDLGRSRSPVAGKGRLPTVSAACLPARECGQSGGALPQEAWQCVNVREFAEPRQASRPRCTRAEGRCTHADADAFGDLKEQRV